MPDHHQDRKVRWLFSSVPNDSGSSKILHSPRLRSAIKSILFPADHYGDRRELALSLTPKSRGWHTPKNLRKVFRRSPRTSSILVKDQNMTENEIEGPEDFYNRRIIEQRSEASMIRQSFTTPDRFATSDEEISVKRLVRSSIMPKPSKIQRSKTAPGECTSSCYIVGDGEDAKKINRSISVPVKHADTSEQISEKHTSPKLRRSLTMPDESSSSFVNNGTTKKVTVAVKKKKTTSQEDAFVEGSENLPSAKWTNTTSRLNFSWSPKRFFRKKKRMDRIVIRKTVLPRTDEERSLHPEEMASFECIDTCTTPLDASADALVESEPHTKRSFSSRRADSRQAFSERDEEFEVRESDYDHVVALGNSAMTGSSSVIASNSRITLPWGISNSMSSIELGSRYRLASKSFTKSNSINHRSGASNQLYRGLSSRKWSQNSSHVSRRSSLREVSTMGSEREPSSSAFWTENMFRKIGKSYGLKNSSFRSSSSSSESSSSGDDDPEEDDELDDSFSISSNSTLSTCPSDVANKKWGATVIFSRSMLDEAHSSDSE